MTVRRLTSAEYAYAIRDLTGIDIKAGIDASSDSVGGEGFANFGDVQFVQDASIERYLEAAKHVADHAVDRRRAARLLRRSPARPASSCRRSTASTSSTPTKGFRVVSGEGGRPFGLERYGKAFFVAWYYKHRAALGDPTATIRGLAAKEGITGRFADHIWTVVNKPNTGVSDARDGRRLEEAAGADGGRRRRRSRRRAPGCDELYKALTTWPSWFFARGDLAAGGAGDESPLVFDDTTLKVEPTHRFTYAHRARAAAAAAAAPVDAGPVEGAT